MIVDDMPQQWQGLQVFCLFLQFELVDVTDSDEGKLAARGRYAS
jgi:hypothetical protein